MRRDAPATYEAFLKTLNAKSALKTGCLDLRFCTLKLRLGNGKRASRNRENCNQN